jgi:hypothetical protein
MAAINNAIEEPVAEKLQHPKVVMKQIRKK